MKRWRKSIFGRGKKGGKCLGGERSSKSMFGRVKIEKDNVWERREGVRVCLLE